MSAAVAAILEGMPEPRDLRMHEHDGRCVITAGPVVLFDYAAGDVVMRNIALAALRQLGFRGRAVAAVLGLTEAYVATLHSAALRDGSAALVMQDRRGTPGKVTAAQWEQARAWRAQGASDAEIGRRLGVAHTTVGRGLGPRGQAARRRRGRRPGWARRSPCSPARAGPGPGRAPEPSRGPLELVPACRLAGGAPAWPLPAEGVFGRGTRGRCCCTRSSRGPAPGRSWPRAGRGAGGRGAAVGGQHVLRAGARRRPSSSSTWPPPRPGRWPGWRCCRGCGRCGPRLAAIADRTDPLAAAARCSRPRCWPRTR